MNHYAKAIEIIASLDRKITDAEKFIATNHPSIFVRSFVGNKTYSLILIDNGGEKIPCIKAIRLITGLGLKEAKDIYDTTPCTIIGSISMVDAIKHKRKFSEIGAATEIIEE